MSDCLIEFHCLPGLSPEALPRPVPASRVAPEWFKSMPATVPGGPSGEYMTFKKCPPLVDALTGGYIIPLVGDVEFYVEPEPTPQLRWRCDMPLVQTHPVQQVQGSPLASRPIVKFMNPWIVTTPPGYSCLFVQPLNRFELPFNIVSGVVETDKYYREVNFPSVCMLGPGQRFLARKGTAIAQVFPFRRESWKSDFGETDMERRRKVEEDLKAAGGGFYKANQWSRKGYE
jgi:hypothetical protein